MSSSNRPIHSQSPAVKRGLVIRDNRVVGGLDLPQDGEAFIAHFNREYAAAGLQVVPARPAALPGRAAA